VSWNGLRNVISGQINTELVKPLTDKSPIRNGYANENGRFGTKYHLNKKLTINECRASTYMLTKGMLWRV